MSRTIVRRVNDRTVIVTKPRGPAGPPGSISAEQTALLAATVAARDAAEAFSLTPGPQGLPGVNGGVGSSAGNAALFAAASGMAVAAGITSVPFAGYATPGKGAGDWVKDAEVDVAFVAANPRWSYLDADGNGWRLSNRGFVNVEQFGALADFVTDDTPAFQAAETYAAKYGCVIFMHSPRYYLAGGFNFHRSVTWLGAGGNVAIGNNGTTSRPGTTIRVGKNVNGAVLNKGNTHDNGVGTQGDATGMSLRGVCFWGGNVNVNGSGVATSFAAGDSPTGHGVVIRGTFQECDDVAAAFFGGDAFHINSSAGSGGESEGNANGFNLNRCYAIYCGGNGLLVNGLDANAGTVNQFSAISCGAAGILEYSFLGNTYTACHVRDCGIVDPTGNNLPTGVCVYAGVHYYSVAGRAAQASTEVPGSVTNGTEAWRAYGGYGGKTWVSGMTWVVGSPYATNPANSNGRNVFTGCYAESGQPPVQAASPSLFFGGLLDEVGFDKDATACWLRGNGTGVLAGSFSTYDANSGDPVSMGFGGSSLVGGKHHMIFQHQRFGATTELSSRASGLGGKKQMDLRSGSLDVFNIGLEDAHGLGFGGLGISKLYIGNGNIGLGSGRKLWNCNSNKIDLNGVALDIGDTFLFYNHVAGAAVGAKCITAGIGGSTAVLEDFGAAAGAPVVQAVASAATVTPAFGQDLVKVTAQAVALAIADPTGTAIPGAGLAIRIKDNGTARAISFGTQYRAIGVTLPTTTVANKTLYLGLIYNADDAKWDVVAVAQEA